MGSVERVKPKPVFLLVGMDCRQLRNCWKPVVFVGVVLLLSWICCTSADGLQPSSRDERSSLWAITDSLQPGDDEEISMRSSSTGESLESNDFDLISPLWELPITTDPSCDLSTPGGGESRASGTPCHDDPFATSDAEGAPQKVDAEEKQVLVACKVKCFRADPVCGEDAITYWCGAAEAKCAGVEVAYKGYCDSRSGGAGNDVTRAAQSLFLVHLLWLVFAGFLVIADLL